MSGYRNHVEPWDGWRVTNERHIYTFKDNNHAKQQEGRVYYVPSSYVDTSRYPKTQAKHRDGLQETDDRYIHIHGPEEHENHSKNQDGLHARNDYLDYVTRLEKTPTLSLDTPQVPNQHVTGFNKVLYEDNNPQVPKRAVLKKVMYDDDEGYTTSEEEYVKEVEEDGIKMRVTTRIKKKTILKW